MREVSVRRGPDVAARSRDIERAAATHDEAALADAIARFDALPLAERLSMAATVARVREVEFVRLVDAVVKVAAGMRRRRDEHGREWIHREPCIVFFVRRKDDDHARLARRRVRLPDHLLTSHERDGVAAIYAIPTDVQSQDRLLRLRAQADTAVRCDTPAGASFGAVACLAADSAGRLYGIAPIHVLSPFPIDGGSGIAPTARLRRIGGPSAEPPFATATTFGGRLASGSTPSFDVQFARVDRSQVGAAFAGLDFAGFVGGPVALHTLIDKDAPVYVFVPSNHPVEANRPPIPATLSLVDETFHIEYEFADGPHAITHRALELATLRPTLHGDSGCAVGIVVDGEVFFVGMHIAGDEETNVSVVIPAWTLLSGVAFSAVGGRIPPGIGFVAARDVH